MMLSTAFGSLRFARGLVERTMDVEAARAEMVRAFNTGAPGHSAALAVLINHGIEVLAITPSDPLSLDDIVRIATDAAPGEGRRGLRRIAGSRIRHQEECCRPAARPSDTSTHFSSERCLILSAGRAIRSPVRPMRNDSHSPRCTRQSMSISARWSPRSRAGSTVWAAGRGLTRRVVDLRHAMIAMLQGEGMRLTRRSVAEYLDFTVVSAGPMLHLRTKPG